MTTYPSRTIHLVDIENLLANPRPLRFEAAVCRARYESLVGPGADDVVIVGCSHGAAINVGSAWPNARLLVRSGPDGADLALLGVIESEGVEARFDRVVIGSGDGIFAGPAARLAGGGQLVTIVSRPEALSRRLRVAASGIVYFSTPPAPATPDALTQDVA